MKLVVGLGNIGDKYVFTRHNVGFMVVDKMADGFKSEKKSLVSKQGDVIYAKPTTFMNLSGEAVVALMDYYKIDVKDILVIYDDLSLDLGVIRLRANGSDGGHNGIKSIIKHLGTKDFARLKIGIGPQVGVSENFVLQNFPKDQHPALKEVLQKSVEAVEFYLTHDMVQTQNRYN